MVSRRDLLARAGRLALLALSGSAPPLLSGCTMSAGAPAGASDPALASLVDAVIGVDMHCTRTRAASTSAPLRA